MKEEGKKNNGGLRRRITLVQFLMMLGMMLILVGVSYNAFRNTYLRFYSEKAQDIVRIVAAETDWERIEPYYETGVEDEYSRNLHDFYNMVKTNFTGIGYLYLFVPGETSFTYILEARTPEDDPKLTAKRGDVFHYTKYEYEKLLPDVHAGKPSTEIMEMSTEMGDGLEAWAPVFDKEGRVRAMVEADYITPEISRELNSYVFRIFLIFLVCIAAVLLIMLEYLRRSVIAPIMELNNGMNAYEHGELEFNYTNYKKDDELKSLADSFREMTVRIEAYNKEIARVTAEKERIGAELDVATKIQADMLPRIFPPFPDRKEFNIFASMDPAKEVGGDFYDFYLLDENHLAMVVADVSGKGVPAALFMVIAKTLIKNRALLGGSPSTILKDVNEQLCEANDAQLFVTVWFAILDLNTGEGVAANAGHEHPVLRRRNEQFKLIQYRHSPALGIMSGMRFQEHEFQLYQGDCLFVYTDGVPEACNAGNEFYGTDRLLEALNEEPSMEPEDLVKAVKDSMERFVGEAPQFDDVTMLVMKYFGKDWRP